MELAQALALVRMTWREVLPGKFASKQAEVLLLAIGLQESRFIHRKQINGPAVGFWQFEKGGGVIGVLNHQSTRAHAGAACTIRGVVSTAQAVYGRLDEDDLLACAFARLLLWSDPRALPELGNPSQAWETYLRNWRPGKPHPDTWDRFYHQSLEAVG